MNFTTYFSTRTKLFVGFGLILLSVLAIVIVSYKNMNSLNQTEEEIISSYEITGKLIQLRSDENRIRTLMLEIILFQD